MKIKSAVTALLLFASIGAVNSQPINRALSFTPEGSVDCGAMPDLDGLKSYSLQFWMNPESWTEGATIMKRGNEFSVKLGASGNIQIINGNSTLNVSSSELKAGSWSQLTLICNDGKAQVLVNGKDVATGTLEPLAASKKAFKLGGGYSGLIDEVRVWNAALNDEMKSFDYFTNNTINKWNPMWENLVAYYKMDQEKCPYMVEYKALEQPGTKGYDNHGEMNSGVKKVLAQNDGLPYLKSAAYTENARFYDRLIPQDAYLLSNEIIILGADCVAADGSVKLRTPNNHATMHGGVNPVAVKGNRTGVVSLDGKAGSYIEAPAKSHTKYKVDYLSNTPYTNSDLNQLCFMTRIFIDRWQPGACIFSKESDDKKSGIAVFMGETEKTLVARVNGETNTSVVLDKLNIGQWTHISVATNPSGGAAYARINFFAMGKKYQGDPAQCSVNKNMVLTDVADVPIKIGEGLEGWLDETYFSNFLFDEGMIQSFINKGVPVPSVERGQAVTRMNAAGFLYNYDDSQNLGYSSISQDNILAQIRKQYEGYTQPKFILSVRGHGENNYEDAFRIIMNDEEKTKKFAQDLVNLSKDYDGVEFDLEWIDESNVQGHSNFQSLPNAVKALLPEGKEFRISIHDVYYSFAKAQAKDPKVTGFTVQQYGPSADRFKYSDFTSCLNTIIQKGGYPANKLMTSFATTMNNDKGVADALKSFTDTGKDFDTYSGGTFMTPLQVYKRAKYTRENGFMGIFYWVMGNDYWLGTQESDGTNNYEGMPKYNMTKYSNFALSSNIDKLATNLVVNHTTTEPDQEIVEPEQPGQDPTDPSDDPTVDPTPEDPGTDNPSDEPSKDPSDQPGDQPGQTPGDQPGDQPGQTPGDQPGDQPGQTPGDQPGDQPGQTPGDQPGDQPGQTPGDQPGDQPGQTPGDQPGDQPGQTPGDQPGDQPGQTPDDQPGDQPGQTPDDQPGDQPGQDPGDNPGAEQPGEDPDAGINDIDSQFIDTIDVYTFSGVLIKKNADKTDIMGKLAPGIYIMGGKKVIVR